ncbi:phosphatase PAP2 family protein [Streptomyces sp. ITFR-16]|uniref:phosphatase PAP2 family protein n=1 Tax=Streptomyces sp. ITFR-16 TaxID=3075198 RepID=UPI0028897D83|nr:phosphatase PAP2 family protein [Streptomyces sp. ITFR-16]WNI22147.1 phosphatase PAP2 family protein [Streptomyces sp. ITFR-16]
MRETPRPQGTAGDAGPELPQRRPGCAFAHTTGASGSGTPHRSVCRPPHTPRGARQTGPSVRPGTTPPVPGRTALLFSAVSGLSALFALTTWQIAADGPLRALDERTGRFLVGHGPRWLTEFLADLGNMQVALPVLGCALFWCLLRGERRAPVTAALAMAAVPLLVVPLKDWIARPGPLTEATGYYPSGHAATAAVAYGAAALLLAPYARRAWMMPVAAVLLTAATGIGLVLRGYHWPLDVLGSWFLCGLLLIPPALSRRSRRRSSSRTPSC